MPFYFNGTEVNSVVFNGTEVDELVFNGVSVWSSGGWIDGVCNAYGTDYQIVSGEHGDRFWLIINKSGGENSEVIYFDGKRFTDGQFYVKTDWIEVDGGSNYRKWYGFTIDNEGLRFKALEAVEQESGSVSYHDSYGEVNFDPGTMLFSGDTYTYKSNDSSDDEKSVRFLADDYGNLQWSQFDWNADHYGTVYCTKRRLKEIYRNQTTDCFLLEPDDTDKRNLYLVRYKDGDVYKSSDPFRIEEYSGDRDNVNYRMGPHKVGSVYIEFENNNYIEIANASSDSPDMTVVDSSGAATSSSGGISSTTHINDVKGNGGYFGAEVVPGDSVYFTMRFPSDDNIVELLYYDENSDSETIFQRLRF